MAEFITQNTALAAYLKTEGFALLDTLTEQYPMSFIFEDCPELRDCIHLWQLGTAAGNICQFFYNYRGLVKRVHIYSDNKVAPGANTGERVIINNELAPTGRTPGAVYGK